MRLQHELTFEQARLIDIVTKPRKEDPTVALKLRTALTIEVAEAFGCRELIYAGTAPRSGADLIKLDGEELDCTVRVEHPDLAFTAVADTVGGFVAKLDGDGPKLVFSVRLKGYAGLAGDLASKVHVDPFVLILQPAQLALNLQEQQPPAEAPEKGDEDTLSFLDEEATVVN